MLNKSTEMPGSGFDDLMSFPCSKAGDSQASYSKRNMFSGFSLLKQHSGYFSLFCGGLFPVCCVNVTAKHKKLERGPSSDFS